MLEVHGPGIERWVMAAKTLAACVERAGEAAFCYAEGVAPLLAVALALTLYYGIALARPRLLGTLLCRIALHLAVLAGYAMVGFYLAVVLTRRRLLT